MQFLSLVPWPLTLTFKFVQARDQTHLPSEFGANPFSSSRDISYTNNKLQTDGTKNRTFRSSLSAVMIKLEAKDIIPNINCMQVTERAEKCRFFVPGDLDLWPLTSSKRGTKHVFRVNLVQIHSAVPETFYTQTKKTTDWRLQKQNLLQFIAWHASMQCAAMLWFFGDEHFSSTWYCSGSSNWSMLRLWTASTLAAVVHSACLVDLYLPANLINKSNLFTY